MRKRTVLIIGLSIVIVITIVTTMSIQRVEESRVETITYINITVEEAYTMIRNSGVDLIIDVRTREEYIQGYIPGAVNIPLHDLEARLSELEKYKNRTILVYCRSGRRSALASEILAKNGFTKVYNMLGGIDSWIKAGYPVKEP